MLSRLKMNRRQALYMSLGALGFGLAACGAESPTPTPDKPVTDATNPPSPSAAGKAVSLNGAGASFPAPLYQKWFAEYNKLHPNVQISYQSVGSGAGVKQFTAATVDFGASDTGMKKEEIEKVPKEKGVLMLPVTAGSIVIAYNLEGVKDLKLPRKVYSAIFLGKITKWNDPEIAKANPGAKLPDSAIAVIYRSDGSGTTANFTMHLSAISEEWKSGPGEGKTVKWPVGSGAKGNEGVTAQVQQTPGAIGYVEFGYAKENKLAFAELENKAGKIVAATGESASKTLAAIKLPEDFLASAADPEGEGSYPIVTYTWLLVYTKYEDADKAKAIKDVLKWALTDGQKLSEELGYVPLPEDVAKKVGEAVEKIS